MPVSGISGQPSPVWYLGMNGISHPQTIASFQKMGLRQSLSN